MAVWISGSGTNMAALLYASRADDCPYEIALVASNNPEAPGLTLSAAEGIATFALPHRGMARADHDTAMERAVIDAGADYIALAGYMRILSAEFVARWEGRMLNIHPSLLPLYKGLDTHGRAIATGDAHGGCSVHLVTADLDDGPVLGQTRVAILPGDTAESLAARVLIAEHQLYPRVLAAHVSRWRDPEWLLDTLRTRIAVLPEVEERESHGAPGWRVGGKYFCHFNDRRHGHDAIAVLVKTDGPEELDALIERDPGSYFRPAYYGASGWIGIRLDRRDLDWRSIDEWLARSWRRTAPKRLAKLQDAVDEF